MKLKNIVTIFITAILVACASIPTQLPIQIMEATNTHLSPSVTFTPKPIFTKTPIPTITLTASLTPTPTLPILLTPEPALIEDFAGNYLMNDPGGSICKLEIKSDTTFTIEFVFKPSGLGETVEGTIFFADRRFFLSSSMRADSDMPLWCIPQALIPVYWGERRFLFIDDHYDNLMAFIVSDFCESLKNSNEQQNNIIDYYYFSRKTDTTVKATGSPVRQDGQLLCS